MYFYKIYGLIIRSQIELPLLVEADKSEGVDAEIVLGNIPKQVMKAISENKDLGIGKGIIWFCNHKGVFVVTDGNRIRVHPANGVRIEETHPFILGYCLAKLFWQRKMLAVHCSAVELFGGGLIISGYSGAGKSTLTTRFVNQGSGFIADDVAVVAREDDVNYIYSAFPYQKLCKDAIKRFGYNADKLVRIDDDRDKFAVNREDVFCQEKKRLGAMCVIREYEGDKVQIRKIEGANKINVFRNNLFLSPMFKYMNIPQEHMYECIKIVSNLPMFVLERPTGCDTSLEQMKLIEEYMISSNIVKAV